MFNVRDLSPQMFFCEIRDHAAARSFWRQTFLNQERFVNFFERVFLFGQSCRKRFDPDRSASEFLVDQKSESGDPCRRDLSDPLQVDRVHTRPALRR